jgi:phage-related minor tail protein
MTDRQVSIRIGVTGKDDVKRAFDEVGRAGQDAFAKVGSAMDTAGAAADREAQRLQRLAQAAKQAAAADAAQQNFNRVLGVGTSNAGSAHDSAKVFMDAAKAAEDLESRTRALRAQIDPLGAAQARLNAEIAEANALFRAGAITAQEQSAAHALAQTRFNGTAKALGAVGASTKLTSSQLVNLSYQFNDVVVSLAGGQRPLMVLLQQGSQISQVFGPGTGITGVLKGVGQALATLITPTTLLVGGIVAVGGAALYAYGSFVSSEKRLEVALGGVGRAAGATIGDLNDIADAAASAGRVSVSAARDMEEAFLRTGRIGVSSFVDLIAVARNYAATTGEDVDAAVKELAAAFADPGKGADALNAKVGFLDDRTRQYVKTLAAQNDFTGAQRALLDALKGSLVDASETTTALGRAWDFVKRNASNALDSIGSGIDRVFSGPSLEQRLRDLQQERSVATGPWGARPLITRSVSTIDAEIAAVQAQLDALHSQVQAAAADAAASRTSVLTGDIARSLTPGFEDLQKLKEEQAKLKAALDDPLARQKIADLVQVEAAYDAVSRAITTWLGPAEKARRLDELEIAALQAKTPAQRAAIAEERRRIELSGEAVTAATAEADIARAGAKAAADATQAIRDQSIALDVNTRATLAVADAWLKGAAAAAEAEARRKALTEAIKNGADVELRTRELLQDQIAEQASQSAKSAADLDAQASAQRRVNDAVAAGLLSSEQARRAMQTEQALRPLIVAEALAEGDAKETLTRVIDALRGAYGRLNSEEARAVALQTLEGQRDQIALLQKQIDLVGEGESQRAVVIAQLQAEQQLRQRGIALTSAEGQAILANAAAIEHLNQSLAQSQAATQELQGLTDSVFGHFAELIAEGKLDWNSWADAGRAALLDIEQEMVKLALLNPLKNLLFGTSLPTLSSVGGIFGSILKGIGVGHAGGMAEQLTATRDVPMAMFRFAPRLHDGAFLSPDEVPAILQRGERVLSREETRRYDGRGREAQAAVYVSIQTPSPAAFQASRTQIAADLARAVRAGMRGL